jgi:isoleucyl-tRNA synthetase
VSDQRIEKVAESYRNIRNTLRYQLSNLYDFDPAKDAVTDAELTPLDRWMLGEFAKLEADVLAAYDAYEFHVVYQRLSQFVSVELSSMYHDLVKDRLYTDPARSPRRRSTQTALYFVVTGLCRMLAPILAFTADEAWEAIPGQAGTSVHESDWESGQCGAVAEPGNWSEVLAIRERALAELEKARQAKTIGKALEAKVVITGKPEQLGAAQADLDTLREILNVSQLHFHPGDGEHLSVEVAKADGQKCERCWHVETDIGTHAEHPTLCGRCVSAVGGLAGS